MTREIDVTQADIDGGGCPVARAAARAGFSAPVVGGGVLQEWTALGTPPMPFQEWALDDLAEAFVRAFDKGDPVSPCTLTLTAVDGGEEEDW